MLPNPLEELQKAFEKFPGIGPRQASRFIFFLMKQPQDLDQTVQALVGLKNNVGLCKECYLPANLGEACYICLDKKRDRSTIYIVEKESDAINMENVGKFSGIYFVLGENISPIQESQMAKTRAKEIIRRIKKDPDKKEVILALNNTREGNFTALYVEELFKENIESSKIKLTRLGRGLSTGSELEYSDEETLRNAFENRR
ncbi:MAG: recombination mediator RecR [Candidatus Spechtbacteria bacterium]|nr:recombination mediator RecR [Candidatus Spechtbacteria bacterium]